jgi:Kef-type K+ transport system membrane component KefB
MGFMDPYLLLTLLFATAAALAWMARRVGLSYVAGYMIAGVAIGLLAPGVSEGTRRS